MYTFAIKTLFCDKGKLLIALSGVCFSLVLINMQVGLFCGLIDKSTLVIDRSGADLWVARRGIQNVDFAHHIPRSWGHRIQGLNGVAVCEACVVGQGTFTTPENEFENVWIVGYEANSELEINWSLVGHTSGKLLQPRHISIDRIDLWKLGNPRVGQMVEINGLKAKVAGTTEGALPFTANPFVVTDLTSAQTFCRTPQSQCSYLLVGLSENTNIARTAEEIRRLLPGAEVFSSNEFARISKNYWLQRTGIGLSFGTATLLGLFVGIVMVGQSLYAMTLEHFSEYAALAAIGAEDNDIRRILLIQASAVALLGSFIGLILVITLRIAIQSPIAPINIPRAALIVGLLINFAVCMLASLLPLHRLRRLDPAAALQG